MAQLNYEVLRASGYKGFIQEQGVEKVMQFGEGNFLRAFVDDFFDIANEKAGWNGKVVLVQPIGGGLSELINQQQGLYTLYLRGSQNGQKVDEKRVISAVSRCLNPYGEWDKVLEFAKSDDLEIIVSNTTEAGIVHDNESAFDQVPPHSFPAKLTRVLYERFTAGKPGIVMLSCELIDNNGKELLKCVNQYIDDWKLSEDFRKWVNEENIFCSTLVDRIVPGRIRDEAEVKRLAEAKRLRRPADRRGRDLRRVGHRGPRGAGGQAALQGRGLPGDGGAGRHPLQEAQGAHPQRRAHRLRAGRVPGGLRHRARLHARRRDPGLHEQDAV